MGNWFSQIKTLFGSPAGASVSADVAVVDGLHDVPTADSAANSNMRDVIGNKDDTIDGDSAYAKIKTIEEDIHAVAKSYPYIAARVTLTGHADALTMGSKVEVIPVASNEIDTVTITHAADSGGNITIWLDEVPYVKAVSIGDINAVAAELRGYSYGDWAVSGSGADVVFTRSGISQTAVFSDTGTTGVTASIVKTQTGAGIGDQFDLHWIQTGVASATDTYIISFYKGAVGRV